MLMRQRSGGRVRGSGGLRPLVGLFGQDGADEVDDGVGGVVALIESGACY
ncbi:hypothetical protein ABLE53_11090 [Nocardioides sp. KR10-350]